MSNNRAQLLKKSLIKFYSQDKHLEEFINVVEKNTEYSLRIIEWFCSNYSKKYNIIYNLEGNKEFNVYLSYKSHLVSYQKKQFDPFKRQHKGYEFFDLPYNKDKKIKTTVGQLNFFKWCIKNKILEFIQKNIRIIKDDMNKSINYMSNTSKGKVDKPNTRKKRQPLSVSASRTCVKRYTKFVMEFN